MKLLLQRHGWWLCLLAGALTPFSFAPFDYWPLGIITVAVFAASLQAQATQAWSAQQLTRNLILQSWLFGTGLFGVGASWVYVSIHDYGYAPLPLAAILTLLFVMGLGLAFALPFYVYGKWFARQRLALLLVFPALWVTGEWTRSWLLTGFPWLYLGYGHLHSPLAAWFPIGSVWSVSLIVAFTAAALAHQLFASSRLSRALPLVIVALLFACGAWLHQMHWTSTDKHTPITIGIVQPNFSLEDKWNPDKRDQIRATLAQQSEGLWNQQLIVWPEAALGELAHEALDFLEPLERRGKQQGTTLITGIPVMDLERSTRHAPIYYNSIIALGNGDGIYHKERLVPFGEYVPLEHWLRGIIRFLDLPMSAFTRGPDHQAMLRVGGFHTAPFICYEIVYPDLVADHARDADFLVTISNDSWFGHSWGPLQHLEMAQARALETGRYLVRSTNNGVSAIVLPDGSVQAATDQFEQETLTGLIYPTSGQTPWMRSGSSVLLLLLSSLLLVSMIDAWRLERQATTA